MTKCLQCLTLAVLAATGTRTANAQTAHEAPDLARLSIEELLRVEVTSVSRKEQRADAVAAAVYVITQDDIRRSGIRTLPELFRLVPGVQVAQVNASNWAVSVRGFNDLYSNKLLVLVDGRSIYNRTFSGVFWSTEELFLDDIDRIEVVRGPGGATWGANAVNGVINIVTKSAYDTRGALVRLGYGSFDGQQAALRYGGRVGSAAYRVYSQWSGRDATLVAPDTSAQDGWSTLTSGVRLDWKRGGRAATVAGSFTTSHSRPLWRGLTSPVPGAYVATDLFSDTRHTGFVIGRLTQSFGKVGTSQLQAFVNRRQFSDPGNRAIENIADLDVEHRVKVHPRHDLVAGGGVRRTVDTNDGSFSYSVVPRVSRNDVLNVFVQDEISVTGRVRLTLGSKFEHDRVAHFGVQPTLRAAWDVVPGRHLVWAAISRALRTPSSNDLGMRVNYASFMGAGGVPVVLGIVGNPEYKTEQLTSTEAGYRASVHRAFTVDVAAFRGHYHRLKTEEPLAPRFEQTPAPAHLFVAAQFANLLDAETTGAEVSAHWTPTRVWRLDGSYSGLRFDPHPDAASLDPNASRRDGNAPAHQWQVHSTVWLGQRTELNAGLFHTGRLRYLEIPAYTRADVRLEVRVANNLSIAAAGQNLLAPSHVEYSPAEIGMTATRVPRQGSIHFTWRFATGS